MRRMLAAALVLGLFTTVFAKASVEDLCARGTALAAKEKREEAAEAFAEALALAVKNKDLAGQERVADSLEVALASLEEADSDARHARLGKTLVALMAALDPKESRAFVSAHALAGHLLMRATREGDGRFVENAAKVISEHARGRKAGRCARAMKDYAEGMVAIAAGDDATGATALGRALDVMAKEGWTLLAAHAGTELAAAWLRLKKEEPAARAMESVASTFVDKKDVYLVDLWRDVVRRRLADAPDAVTAPHELVGAPYAKMGRPGMRGGRGGRGGSGNDVSKIGAVLPRLSARKPMFTVAREEEEFVFRAAYLRGEETIEAKPFVHHFESGGVVVSFHGHAVALRMVDLSGLKGGPGGRTRPSVFRAFYHLGKGEKYGVTREGLVTIGD